MGQLLPVRRLWSGGIAFMKYEEVPEIAKNRQAAKSFVGMRGHEKGFALCGHTIGDAGEVESSVFEVFEKRQGSIVSGQRASAKAVDVAADRG